ncbi:hypothetical protein B9Z55_023466 [Caenorhabditis nigoni]|uniref:Uncharacterized protein n=1 Tax=Caenorhabditis nigoni TaxID=1611254 RepID=A0A2G5SPW2_9PELO|nr:hypothetical protein B9Z55_023466 [Caenorhabditis nigoni]
MPPNQNSKVANFSSLIQKDAMYAGAMPQPPSQLQTDEGLTDFFSFFPIFKPAKLDKHPVHATAAITCFHDSVIHHSFSKKKTQKNKPSNAILLGHPYAKHQDGPLRGSLKVSTTVNSMEKSGCNGTLETKGKQKGHSNKRAKPTKKKFTKEELEEIENQIEEIMKPPTISEKCLHENRCALLEKYNLNFFQFPPDYIREVVQDVKEKHKNEDKLQKRNNGTLI